MRLGINGFGRIGRLIFRILHEQGMGGDVVFVNDPAPNAALAQLLRFDSNYGRFPVEIDLADDGFVAGSHHVTTGQHLDPAEIPWADHGVDIVIESSGIFKRRSQSAAHLAAGAKKVIISSPSPDSDIDIVVGINHDQYDSSSHDIVSNASCTTNSLAAVMQILDNRLGIGHAMLTTVHAYTNGQNILDGAHKDPRRARNAATNIIPTTTGAAKAIGKLLPGLRETFDGGAIRVPVATGSLCDLTLLLEREATVDEINQIMRDACASTTYQGIVEYSTDPLVSSDIVANPHSAIFDSLSTRSLGKMAKVFVWYDNEWGYSCRMVDVIKLVAADL